MLVIKLRGVSVFSLQTIDLDVFFSLPLIKETLQNSHYCSPVQKFIYLEEIKAKAEEVNFLIETLF